MTNFDESEQVPPEARNFTAPPEKPHMRHASPDDATALEQLKADTKTIRERFSAEWRARAAALEAVQSTGNLAEDAKALFQADEIDPSRVNPKYNLKEESGLVRYLTDLQRATKADAERVGDEDVRAYDQALVRAIERIFSAHRTAAEENERGSQ